MIFLELYVADVRETVSMFRALFDIETMNTSDTFADMRLGPSRILLNGQPLANYGPGNPIHELPTGTPRGAGIEICIESDNVDRCHELAVADQRWTVTSPLHDQSWGLRDFRVVHPEGFYVRVTSAPSV